MHAAGRKWQIFIRLALVLKYPLSVRPSK